jgi:hypothetical protein
MKPLATSGDVVSFVTEMQDPVGGKPWARPTPSEEEDPPPPEGGGPPVLNMSLGTLGYPWQPFGPSSYHNRFYVQVGGDYPVNKDTLRVMLRWQSIYGGVSGPMLQPAWNGSPYSYATTAGSNSAQFISWNDTDTSGWMGAAVARIPAPYSSGAWFMWNFATRAYGPIGSSLVKITIVPGTWVLNGTHLGGEAGWYPFTAPQVRSGTNPGALLQVNLGIRDTLTYKPFPDGGQ